MMRVLPSSGVVVGVVFATAISVLSLSTLWMLFGEWNVSSSPLVRVMLDSEFWQTIVRTLTFAMIAIALKALLAWLLIPYFYKHGNTLLSSLLLIPWLVPTSVAALAWLWFFYDIGGGINYVLGPQSIDWLGNPRRAFAIVLALNVWREAPLWAFVLAPSIAGCSVGLSRLATIDGLTQTQYFRLVIFPRMRPVLCALALLSIIWTIGEFESVWLLTRGGPGEATEFITLYAFKHAFLSQDMAFGAATYICTLPMLSSILFALIWLYKRSVERSGI